MIYLFLADGFEEIEALATLDILRRADLPVLTVGVTGETVTGAHSISVEADISIGEVEPDRMEALILPGGMPGTTNLEKSEDVMALLAFAAENNILICAICAAPMILGKKGLLAGKRATCYPGFEKYLTGATLEKGVIKDGNIITASGAGVALSFGYTICDALGRDGDKLKKEMQYE